MWKQYSLTMEAAKTVVALFVVFVQTIHPILGLQTNSTGCPADYYYDPALEDCEPCYDICEKAEWKGTVQQCWDNCPPYALRLWPPKSPTTPSPPAKPGPPPGSSGMGGTLAGIIVPIVGVICLVVVAGLAFQKRHIIINKLRRGRQRPNVEDNEGQMIQMLPLQGGPNDEVLNIEDGPDGEDRGEGESAIAVTVASSTTVSGVQEQGEEPHTTPNGEMPFWRGVAQTQPSDTPSSSGIVSGVACTDDSHVKLPVQASENHDNTTEMALAGGAAASFFPFMDDSLPPDDYDSYHSTEPKSVSLSSPSFSGGLPEGMPRTNV